MALAQLRQRLHLQPAPRRQHLRRLVRAREIAAVDRVKFMMRRAESHRQRLAHAGLVQRDIGLALDAPVHVPVGLAMADKTDAGNHVGLISVV